MNDEKTYQWYLDTKEIETWCYVEDAFSSEEVNKIIQAGEKENIIQAQVYSNITDNNARNTSISWIPSSDKDNEWLFRRLTDIISNINKKFFNYDITTLQNLQYSIYQQGGFYKDHVDIMSLTVMGNRKLSFSIMLTDPEEYKGGELLLKTSFNPIETPKKRGTVVFFPSYVLHEVTPVTEGTRKTLVGWVLGPNFK